MLNRRLPGTDTPAQIADLRQELAKIHASRLEATRDETTRPMDGNFRRPRARRIGVARSLSHGCHLGSPEYVFSDLGGCGCQVRKLKINLWLQLTRMR